MNAQDFCVLTAESFGWQVFKDDEGKIYIHARVVGREYFTYRDSWEEMASVVSVLMDIEDLENKNRTERVATNFRACLNSVSVN